MRKYTLTEILDSKYDEPPNLIEEILWEQDNVILLGAAKTTKSVFLQQLAFSTSAGTPFLDQYKVKRPCKVAYFWGEGKVPETASRCKRMAKEVAHNGENLWWFHVPGIALNHGETLEKIYELLGNFRPDIMIFDPLYKMKSHGSLKDDDVAGDMTTSWDILKEKYKCAIIVAHHEHRVKYIEKTNKIIEEGDNAIFGSFVWQAWPDHIFLLRAPEGKKSKKRFLSCVTQRSAKVIENIELILLEPDPLLFEVADDKNLTQRKIMQLLATKLKTAMHYGAIARRLAVSESSVLRGMRALVKEGIIQRLDGGMYILQEVAKNAKTDNEAQSNST